MKLTIDEFNGLTGELYFSSLLFNDDGFRVLLELDEQTYTLCFSDFPKFFRSYDEGDMLCFDYRFDLDDKHLREVKDSELINWFHDRNARKYEKLNLKHIQVNTSDEILDVIFDCKAFVVKQ